MPLSKGKSKNDCKASKDFGHFQLPLTPSSTGTGDGSPAEFEHKDIISYSELERVNNHSDIKHNGVRGVLEYLKLETSEETIIVSA